jgi:hypothetical protein
MCLAVFFASPNEAPLIEWKKDAPAFCVMDLTDNEQEVRNRFSYPYVYYAGSYEGCGCGFGMRHLDEDLKPDAEDIAEQKQSNADYLAFYQYIVSLLPEGGTIEIFVCWEGEHKEQIEATHRIRCDELKNDDFIFEQRHYYYVDVSV